MAPQPMYQQITEDLRKRIALGAGSRPGGGDPTPMDLNGQLPMALKPGTQLPTEGALGTAYGASRNTIRDAIKRLTSLGLVETRQGKGTFVTWKTDPFVTVLSGDPQAPGGAEGVTYLSDVTAAHRTPRVSSPKVEIQAPSAEVSRRLRVAASTQVVSRHELRYIDETPWSMQTSFYPMSFITRGATRLLIAENIVEGTVRYIAQAIDVRQLGYRDWITARGPDLNEQTFFGLSHDATVFEIFRTAFDQTGTPLRVTVTVFPTDRNQFIIDVGDVPSPEYNQADQAEPQERASEST
jgi:GntR family transcriptional regulator